ncbi:MAG TPA: cytochrome c [Solirubrobacteraceae bacterium]|nr:cytochrome c [Solirubrobacteraceae bacterium]
MSLALLAIILVFVVLALGAFFLAMSGGSKGAAKERRAAEGRKGVLGATIAFLAALVVLGIAIPLGIFNSDKDRDEFPAESIAQLSSLQLHGQELFGQQCRRCHTLAASNAVSTVGPSLDQLAPPKALVLDAIENGRARGNGQMAADLVEGEDAEAVAQYVAVAVGQNPEAGGEESGGSAEESGGSAEEPDTSSDESGTSAEDSESSE